MDFNRLYLSDLIVCKLYLNFNLCKLNLKAQYGFSIQTSIYYYLICIKLQFQPYQNRILSKLIVQYKFIVFGDPAFINTWLILFTFD